jgi:hypothetical protein
MRERAARLAALAALLCAACFAETPTVGGETTGEPCPMGARGCMCYPNGTCDPELECDASSSMCIPQGCTPGALECACMDGTCTHPWVCEGGICLDDSEGSTGGTSTIGTDASSDAGVTSDATWGVTSVDPDSTGSSTGSTTGASACASESNCSECQACASSQGEPCAEAYAACTEIGRDCTSTVMCQEPCAFLGFSCDDCCGGVNPVTGEAADALTECRKHVCDAACPAPGAFPTCGPD